jgi:eukaryotic-like serine/threonine-protein kinase
MKKLKISIGQYSSKGIKDHNEDSFGVLVPKGHVLESKGITAIIADGMGSCEHPKQASENCVHGFLNDYYSTPDSWTVKSSAAKVLTALNSWLYSQDIDRHVKAYVSTFSSIIFKSTTAHLFHIGDSRIYRLRQNQLKQLSQDHRIWISKQNNYLSRAIGIDLHLDIDYKTSALEKDDIFIMTTDGIHDYLKDEEIKQLILDGILNSSLDSIAHNIVKASLQHKSHDNVTCQIIQIKELPSQEIHEAYNELTKLPFPPELEPGMTLDHYQIIKEINASARSQLYLVKDTISKKMMIMKTPSVNYEDDPGYIEQFYLEEWAGKRLNHSNLLITYDAESLPQHKKRSALYFLMEYIEGISLQQWIKKNPQPDIKQVIVIVEQIIKGLRSIHRMEMLHRDLKPDNIMIDANGLVKIIDFGSIKIAGVQEISTPIKRHDLLGTMDYSAPEYLLGVAASKQSDLFSVASISYELLTGKLPYANQLNRSKLTLQQLKLDYTPSYNYNPMIPFWFDSALRKALHPEVKQRYDSFSEFISDLNRPNELFLDTHIPFNKKNPTLLWQLIAAICFILNIILVYYCST